MVGRGDQKEKTLRARPLLAIFPAPCYECAMGFFRATPPPAEISGVRVVPSRRARRMNLRVEARTGEVVLTLPPRASVARAQAFVEKSRRWIESHRQRAQELPGARDGMRLAVRGAEYTLRHVPGRGLSRFEGEEIIIHGAPEHLPRRLRDFLKAQAAEILPPLAAEKASRLGLPPVPLRVLDPRARWGSCGPDGRIMLSWRLVLTPPLVMDYVVAHEVAHRRHLNHGKKFWALCDSLCEDGPTARAWLKAHGDRVMRMI